jgi:hypothetical protein
LTGPAAVTQLLDNILSVRRYCDMVNAPGPHVVNVYKPPSRSTAAQLKDVILGK